MSLYKFKKIFCKKNVGSLHVISPKLSETEIFKIIEKNHKSLNKFTDSTNLSEFQISEIVENRYDSFYKIKDFLETSGYRVSFDKIPMNELNDVYYSAIMEIVVNGIPTLAIFERIDFKDKKVYFIDFDRNSFSLNLEKFKEFFIQGEALFIMPKNLYEKERPNEELINKPKKVQDKIYLNKYSKFAPSVY